MKKWILLFSTVVTRSSESKYNNSSVHTREYELNDNNYTNNSGNNIPRSVWSRGKNLVWNKCYCIWRYCRYCYNLQYDNCRSRFSIRNNRKSSRTNRNNRHNKGYLNRFHYYFLLSLLTVSPAYADSEPEI